MALLDSFDQLIQEGRYAFRSLRRSPGASVVIVATLSIGIAVATVFFSYVNTSFFRALPYPNADRTVVVYKSRFAPDDLLGDLLKTVKSFDRVAMYSDYNAVFSDGVELVSVSATRVDSGFFPIVKLKPILGTLPTGRDVVSGAPMVVIGERLWRKRLNSSPDVIGKMVTVRGERRRIAAVLDANFTFPAFGELWIPEANPNDEGQLIYSFLAELRRGVTHEYARSEIKLFTARVLAARPALKGKLGGGIFFMSNEMVSRGVVAAGFTRTLGLVIGATLCVLLVACANIALLQMARGFRRRGELIVRAALGASRWQLIRQQLLESVMLALLASVVGLILADSSIQLVLAYFLPNRVNKGLFPGWMHFGIDWRVASFAVAVALVTVIVFGLWPARVATRFDLSKVLRSDADRSIVSGDPTRSAHMPIILQIALSLGLFTGALLLAQNYRRLARIDPGYQPKGLYEARLASDADSGWVANSDSYRQVQVTLNASPGVAVAISSRFRTVSGEVTDRFAYLPGATAPVIAANEWRPDPNVVSDNYFRVMGMPVLAGRPFDATDNRGTGLVAVVSKQFAIEAWPGESPLGKTLAIGRAVSDQRRNVGPKSMASGGAPMVAPTAVVIGVVGDLRLTRADAASGYWSEPDVYLLDRQTAFATPSFMIRASSGTQTLTRAVAGALGQVGLQTPVELASWEAQASRGASTTKGLATMMIAFATICLLLAVMGIYGLVAFNVQQRTREIGVRMALGARPADVIRGIVLSGARLVWVGLALGLLIGSVMGRVLTGLVVGSAVGSFAAALAATVVFGGVAVAASYIPARRAANLNPVNAIRE